MAWFANFIRLYTVPMPMRKELRIDFARKRHLYNGLRSIVDPVTLTEHTVQRFPPLKRGFLR